LVGGADKNNVSELSMYTICGMMAFLFWIYGCTGTAEKSDKSSQVHFSAVSARDGNGTVEKNVDNAFGKGW